MNNKKNKYLSRIQNFFNIVIIPVALSGCATQLVPPAYVIKPQERFNETLPVVSDVSQAERLKKMQQWWGQFNDPVLLELINNAQNNNPSISAAVVNLKTYETLLVGTQAKNIPSVGFNGGISRGALQQSIVPTMAPLTTAQLGLQTSWELDLLGTNQLAIQSGQHLIKGAKATWHEARILVAAEVARSYFNYYFCKASYEITRQDYESRLKQNDTISLNVKAGFETPSALFTSSASLAQSRNNLTAVEAQCKVALKGLVALTAIEETVLSTKLKMEFPSLRQVIEKNSLYLPISVPGELITQRPDIFNSKQQLEAAALNVGTARAENYPKIAIAGNISKTFVSNTSLSGWSIGPLSISLPIFDGGRIKANENLSLEKYEHAKVDFSAKLRVAIKEVETALVNLAATEEKTKLNQTAVDGYQKSYKATNAKYQAGLTTLFELEDNRRLHLHSLNSQLGNQQERLNAWIDLYKALGGGFQHNQDTE